MKLEEDRSAKMAGMSEEKVTRMEDSIRKLRDRLVKEREILVKHEITLGRKQSKGEEPGLTQEKIEKKQDRIAMLEVKMEEMEVLCGVLRQEISRIIKFKPLQSQLEDLPKGFRRAREGEWDIPNSRFKTFQDVFTPHEARVLPSGKRPTFARDYDALSLGVCPIDPDRIPDWFIREFSLGNLEGLDSFEKLEAKMNAFPAVRGIFRHLVPVEAYGQKSYRVMILKDYAPEHDGKIMIVSYSGAKKRETDHKGMQLFESTYAAKRRSGHIEQQYHDERAKLHGIKARVRQIQMDLIGMRQGDPKRQEISKRLSDEVGALGRVTNIHKVQAADIMRDVAEIKDTLGRHNPGATCARMVRALNRLNERLPQIFEKSPRVMADSRLLEVHINKAVEALDGTREGLLALCEALEEGAQGMDVERRLRQLPILDDLIARPFSRYARKLGEKKAALRGAMSEGDRMAVRHEAINAYVACKTFQIQHERERILGDIAASPMETGIDALLERSRKLLKIATSKETFKDVRTGQNEPYREMVGKVIKLVRGLEAYQAKNLSQEERLEMYERLKKYLEEIDFAEILEKL